MTEYQKRLVEDSISVIEKVIRRRIRIPNKPLQTYEDYYSVGCEAICTAAINYTEALGEFEPYASRVIYNAIIDYSRSMDYRSSKEIDITSKDGESLLDIYVSVDSSCDREVAASMTLAALLESKSRYRGIARLGIEAMELKLCGYQSSEIAQRYGTTINNVNAWIARARQKLRADPAFLAVAN